MSLAANSPRPCGRQTRQRVELQPLQGRTAGGHLPAEEHAPVAPPPHLDAGAAEVDVGPPLVLHPAVLGGARVHYRRLAVGGATFSLGHVLVGAGATRGHCLWLWPEGEQQETALYIWGRGWFLHFLNLVCVAHQNQRTISLIFVRSVQ